MTWSQVMWKIQNRKRAQKKRKTDAKNRKRAQFEKVFELIIHFRVSRVFFPLPDTFWKSVRLRFFCGFFALFCGFFASKCGGAMCQGMPMHDRALPKEQKPSGFESQSQHLWSAPLFQEGYSALRSYTHAQGWKLFNTKPKLYMQQEIGNLSCMDWQCQYAVSSMDCFQFQGKKKGCSCRTRFCVEQNGSWAQTMTRSKIAGGIFPQDFATWQDENFIGRVACNCMQHATLFDLRSWQACMICVHAWLMKCMHVWIVFAFMLIECIDGMKHGMVHAWQT